MSGGYTAGILHTACSRSGTRFRKSSECCGSRDYPPLQKCDSTHHLAFWKGLETIAARCTVYGVRLLRGCCWVAVLGCGLLPLLLLLFL